MPRSSAANADLIQAQCLAGRTRQLTRRITRIYDEALRPLNLRGTQLSILVAVARAGRARPSELARELELEQSTSSRNLRLMKQKGWLAESECSDRRCQQIRLTRKGEALLERAIPLWRGAQRRAKRELGPELLEALMSSGTASPGESRWGESRRAS